MKAELITLTTLLAIAASPALAIQRQQTMNKTCSEVQSLVRAQGAVILQYPGTRSSGLLYDRAVATSEMCFGSGYGERTYVPARDRRDCAVWVCRPGTNLRP